MDDQDGEHDSIKSCPADLMEPKKDEVPTGTQDDSNQLVETVQIESNKNSTDETQPSAEAQILAVQDLKPDGVPNCNQENPVVEKKKEDEKLYKVLAIKLKKELVKCRDELKKIQEISEKDRNSLNEKVDNLQKALDSERQEATTSNATLEATVKNLKQRIEVYESDLENLQSEFESYKDRASKLMQQSNSVQFQGNKLFEEERFKQMKELNDEQLRCIKSLESQLSIAIERNKKLEDNSKKLEGVIETLQEKLTSFNTIETKYSNLTQENENLKLALKQFKIKHGDSMTSDNLISSCDYIQKHLLESEVKDYSNVEGDYPRTVSGETQKSVLNIDDSSPLNNGRNEDLVTRLSPSVSVKDDSQTTSGSSLDGSASGYVHIKPTTFEIISRSSVLEDAQNQIDNLTKAYMDSENTNSLLSDQVKALKEEIRRLQLATERMELANNLEYLKNVVFKFLSLDGNQAQHKQRLVPVLSTVLKLSPDETAKLNTLSQTDKSSLASSFFKL